MEVPQTSAAPAVTAYREKGPAATGSAETRALKSVSKRRFPKWLLWLCVFLFVGIVVVSQLLAPRIPLVTIETANTQDLRTSFTAEAYVKGKDYDLSPQAPGRIIELLVNEGDNVRAGQVLFRLEDSQAQALFQQARSSALAASAAVSEMRAQLAQSIRISSAQTAAAKAALNESEAQMRLAIAGARPEQVAQAQHQVERIQAVAVNAEKAYERADNLYKQGAIARANVDAAEATYKSAKAELAQAQSALALVKAGPRQEEITAAKEAVETARANVILAESASSEIAARKEAVAASEAQLKGALSAVQADEAALAQLIVKSPANGVVSKVSMQQGMQATPGLPVLTISSRQDLRIDAEISSEDAAKVKVGMPVIVTSPAYPGRIFQATVASFSSVGELKPDAAIRTRIIRARVNLLKDWSLFKPGMEVDVEGQATLRRSLLVPSDSISLNGDQTSVWILRPDGTVHNQVVQTGFSNANQTEVLSGLEAGDKVVVRGKDVVKEGGKVRVKP